MFRFDDADMAKAAAGAVGRSGGGRGRAQILSSETAVPPHAGPTAAAHHLVHPSGGDVGRHMPVPALGPGYVLPMPGVSPATSAVRDRKVSLAMEPPRSGLGTGSGSARGEVDSLDAIGGTRGCAAAMPQLSGSTRGVGLPDESHTPSGGGIGIRSRMGSSEETNKRGDRDDLSRGPVPDTDDGDADGRLVAGGDNVSQVTKPTEEWSWRHTASGRCQPELQVEDAGISLSSTPAASSRGVDGDGAILSPAAEVGEQRPFPLGGAGGGAAHAHAGRAAGDAQGEARQSHAADL